MQIIRKLSVEYAKRSTDLKWIVVSLTRAKKTSLETLFSF